MFEKTTVYHSALVGAGQLRITVLSGAKPSKFKKEGTPNVFLDFEHEGKKHQYTAETQQCADALAAHEGEEITIKASGSRNDARIAAAIAGGGAVENRYGRAVSAMCSIRTLLPSSNAPWPPNALGQVMPV